MNEQFSVYLLVRVDCIVPSSLKHYFLPEEYQKVLGKKVASAESVNSLEGGIWLKRFQLAQVLSCVFKLLLLATSVGQELLELLLRYYGDLLFLHAVNSLQIILSHLSHHR